MKKHNSRSLICEFPISTAEKKYHHGLNGAQQSPILYYAGVTEAHKITQQTRRFSAWGYRRLAIMFCNRIFPGSIGSLMQNFTAFSRTSYPAGQSRLPALKAASLVAGTTMLLSQSTGIAQAKEIDFHFQKPDIPLYGVDDNLLSDAAFVDIDGDGDFDAFISGSGGKYDSSTITYYENVGTNTEPLFRERVSSDNPLNVVDTLFVNGGPSFVDIDGDGDFDAFIGQKYGYSSSSIQYYENTGTRTVPVFTHQDGGDNPLDGVTVGFSNAGFVDIDGDGDFDAFIRGGRSPATIQYYENTGTPEVAVFTEKPDVDNPLFGIDPNAYNGPGFVDIDGDGDFDAFIGNYFYRNTGTDTAPVFTQQTGSDDPLDGINIDFNNSPSFVDIDGDGDFDAFIGQKYGSVMAVKNNGSAATPLLQVWADPDVPLSGLNVSYRSQPGFVDIDNDGDSDVFIGDEYGIIRYYKNIGSTIKSVFSEQTGAANPFDGVNVGGSSKPFFVDIDNDGDFDAFIGENAGIIHYYENTGTNTVPVFTEQTGAANPFDGVDVGNNSSPFFVDIDGDGDFDAFVGEWEGIINYFENTGTNTAPVFTEQIGTANPFDGVDVGYMSSPSFVDIDGNGVFEAFIGEKTGIVNYFENTGTKTTPLFTQHTGWRNPFNGVDVGYRSSPSFVDIDGNSRMDAFIGSGAGKILYYQNYYFPWNLFLPAMIKKN